MLKPKVKSKISSSFKNYFSLSHKSSYLFRKLIPRFKENFQKNKLFRVSFLFSISGIGICAFLIFTPSSENSELTRILKVTYIENNFSRHKKNYQRNKSMKNLERLVEQFFYKVDYTTKNKLYKKESIYEDIKYLIYLIQENGLLNQSINLRQLQIIGLLISYISENLQYMLLEEAFHKYLLEFAESFTSFFKIKLTDDKFKYDFVNTEYIQDNLMTLVTISKIIVSYSTNNELIIRSLRFLIDFISKSDKSIPELLFKQSEESILDFLKLLAVNKDFKIKDLVMQLIEVLCTKEVNFILTLIFYNAFSNILLLYSTCSSNEEKSLYKRLLDLLKLCDIDKIKEKLDDSKKWSENIETELYRLYQSVSNSKVGEEVISIVKGLFRLS